MRNLILPAFFVTFAGMLGGVFVGGAFSVANAQNSPTTTRVKTSTEITPSWTYKGHWYGFVTCSRLQREGNTVTPDQVKQCIDAGGKCILSSGGAQVGLGRMDLGPNDKCKEYAAQQVLVLGTMTSAKYGTGPTSDEAVEGLAAGGDRPASKFEGVTIISAAIQPKLAPTGRVDTSRMTETSQQ